MTDSYAGRQRATIVVASHYKKVEDELVDDPNVISMARSILDNFSLAEDAHLWHDNWQPTSRFMTMANTEYYNRGGQVKNRHIGAVANAITRIVRAEREPPRA